MAGSPAAGCWPAWTRPTSKGLAAGEAIRQAVRDLEERWSAEIGEPGWQQLRRHLAQLAAAAPVPAA